MTSETCDVIVMGCGGFGSSTMYHLARRGLKVIGIDRFHPPHNQGSSHGETRIIRKAYFEHPNYVPLLHRAWVLWEELSDESRINLIEQRNLLMSGPLDSEIIEGARRSAQEHRLPLEDMNHSEASRRFPMFRLPEDHSVTVEASAGFLWAERCVETNIKSAIALGAELRCHEIVRSIDGTPGRLEVQTDRAKYSAAAGVVTCGAWTGQLLPGYARKIVVQRKTLSWLPMESDDWARPEKAPMFLMDVPEGQFYGLPSVDGKTIKVGMHTGGDIVTNPCEMDRTPTPEDEAPLIDFASTYLNGIHPGASQSVVCMYSMSPDGHFLLDRLPDLPLVVAAGFSGHGFKFTSVLGEVAADLIQYGRSPLDIDFLSAERFRV